MPKHQILKRSLTQKQWDTYIPARDLARNLRKIAAHLAALPSDVRGKIHLKMEIGRRDELARGKRG